HRPPDGVAVRARPPTLQKRVELTRRIEPREVVVPAHVPIADPDLRHGRTPAPLDHLAATLRLLLDVDLEPRGALRRKQALRHAAVGAPALRIHLDLGHGSGRGRLADHSGSVIGMSSHMSWRKVPMKNDMNDIVNTADGKT